MNPSPPPTPGEPGHNGVMSTLPPPAPQAQPAPSGPPAPPADPGPNEFDLDRLIVMAKQWYQPLTQRHTWTAAWYLFVGVFTAVGFFIALNAVGWLMFSLAFVGIGLLLVRPFLAMVEALCRVERSMATWVGVEIPARPIAPIAGLGLKNLQDPERWRQIGFLAANVIIGTAIGSVGTTAYLFAPNLVFDGPTWAGQGLWPFAWLLGAIFGLFMLGAAPRIAVAVARVKASITGWFLGPDELAAARQRVSALSMQRHDILDAVAAERRRIERNLHDGVQQQLVAIGLDLGMADQHLSTDPERARELIRSASDKIRGSIGELRQLGRGLHPAILEDRGIDAALSAVVANAPIPISVVVDPDLGLSTDAAETVYFVCNEAVANVFKHANARVASVHVTRVGEAVRITVHDDGRGGVEPSRGTGVAGMRARVHAVDGQFTVVSPVGGPTTVTATIPRVVN